MSCSSHNARLGLAAAIGVTVVLFAGAVQASGAPVGMVAMGSHPLQVGANAYMQFDARFDGASPSEFDWSVTTEPGGVAFTDWISPTSMALFGPGREPAAVSGPTLSGVGTQADPFALTSQYDRGVFDVTEAIRYVDGSNTVAADWTIQNTADTVRSYRLAPVANVFHVVTTEGEGALVAGPGRILVAYNDEIGSAVALVEDPSSPWASYGEGDYMRVMDPALKGPWGPYFDSQVQQGLHDDNIGVEFDGTLAPGATDVLHVTWMFIAYDGVTLQGPDSPLLAGQTATVNAAVHNRALPVADVQIRYEVTGANTAEGSVTTSGGGSADIAWKGANPGTDTLTAYVDSDADGAQDDNEIARAVTITFTASPASPASESNPILQGVLGAVVHAPVAIAPSNLFSIRSAKVDRHSGGATFVLRVPGRGTVVAVVRVARPVAGHSARTLVVGRAVATPTRAGRVNLVIRPRKAALRILRARHVLRTTLRITYTPSGGVSRTVARSLVLRLGR